MADRIGCTKMINASMIPNGMPVDYYVAYGIVRELLKEGYLIIQSKEMENGEVKVFWEMECNAIGLEN